MRSVLALTAALVACSGDGVVVPPTTTPTGATGDTAPVVTNDTGYELGDMGTLLLTYHQDTRRAYAYGFFAESLTGFPNLAECAVKDVACYPRLPEDFDVYEEYDPRLKFEPDVFVTRYLGLQVQLGPYNLDYYNAPNLDHSFYYADLSQTVRENGWFMGDIGFGWNDPDSMWQPPHEPKPDIFVPQLVELQRPAPGEVLYFPNGTRLPIEWVPTGIGETYIRVEQEFGIARVYRVNDDGYWELDIDELGFGEAPETFRIALERWTRNSVRRKGNLIDVASMTDVSFEGNYFNIGNRDPITPADRCAEAQGQAPLGPGAYWGRLAETYQSSLSGFAPCTNNYIDGLDAIIKVVVGPKESLTAVLNMKDQSASLYALETCGGGAIETCVTGSDKSVDNNFSEFIQLFNPTEDTQTRYLIVDSTFPRDEDPGPDLDTGLFTLDITSDVLTEPEMYDSCTEANQGNVLTAGNYYAEFTAFSATLNPGTGGCTGTSMPGPEGMATIELAPGQTVDIGAQTTGADIGIYLLTNCTDPFSTPAGACSDVDLGVNQQENVSYTNAGAATERLTLVVDSKSGLQPYFLAINIF